VRFIRKGGRIVPIREKTDIVMSFKNTKISAIQRAKEGAKAGAVFGAVVGGLTSGLHGLESTKNPLGGLAYGAVGAAGGAFTFGTATAAINAAIGPRTQTTLKFKKVKR
jgi:hypothetical protein